MGESTLKLQANPSAQGGIGWAVVKDAYVRLKEGPSDSTQDMDHLRRGGVYRLERGSLELATILRGRPGETSGTAMESRAPKGWVRDSELEHTRRGAG